MSDHKRLFVTIQILALIAVAVGLPGLNHAQATITVVNRDTPDEGFNDPRGPDTASTAGGNDGSTIGAQRLIAFQFAADIWAGLLLSSEEIVVAAEFNPLSCEATSATLGAAGTNTAHRNFTGAPVSNTWYPAALANALAGADLAPNDDDIRAIFNSDLGDSCPFPRAWYYGLDGNPPANTIDFVSIVLHELAHGLGFQTFVDHATGAKLNNLDDIFMLWLEDHSTGKLYPDMTDADRVSASINTGNLYWVGPDVVAKSGGLTSGRHPSGHVEMYAPNPQDPGASVSHFSTSLKPDQLMEPFYSGANHNVGLSEALMRDIGWSTTILAPTEYTLLVNPIGSGSVALDPPGGTYPPGTVVTLTAAGIGDGIFSVWSGPLTGVENPKTITMDSNKSVTANFIEVILNSGVRFTRRISIDPGDIAETAGRPDNILYAMIEMAVQVAGTGDTAVVTMVLPNPAPAGYNWYKYTDSDGWILFDRNNISGGVGDGAEFNPARTQITLYITDNGPYDDDPADGIIFDPSGLGLGITSVSSPTTPSSGGGSGGGGGGCFITTLTVGAPPASHFEGLHNP